MTRSRKPGSQVFPEDLGSPPAPSSRWRRGFLNAGGGSLAAGATMAGSGTAGACCGSLAAGTLGGVGAMVGGGPMMGLAALVGVGMAGAGMTHMAANLWQRRGSGGESEPDDGESSASGKPAGGAPTGSAPGRGGPPPPRPVGEGE